MKFFKRLAIVIMASLMCLALTACGDLDIDETAYKNLVDAISGRIEKNKEIIDEMMACGLITSEAHDNLVAEIDMSFNRWLADTAAKELDESFAESTGSAVTGWWTIKADEDEDEDLDGDGNFGESSVIVNQNSIFTNQIYHASIAAAGGITSEAYTAVSEKVPAVARTAGRYDGSNHISILPDDLNSDWVQRVINCEIYVLAENTDIAAAMSRVNSAKTGINENRSTEEIQAMLDKSSDSKDVFVKAGDGISLLDVSSNLLLHESEKSDNVSYSYSGWTGTAKSPTNTSRDSYNMPGTDIIVNSSYNGTNYTIMTLKTLDLDYVMWRKIKNALSLADSTYMIVGNRAYLMQYQVGVVSGYTVTKSDPTKDTYDGFEANIENGNMFINLYTGRVGKIVTGASFDGSSTETEIVYYTLTDDESNRLELSTNLMSDGSSQIDANSFIVHGKQTVKLGVVADDLKKTDIDEVSAMNSGRVECEVPMVVLRDYLELTYSPGVIKDEHLVAYGRMIRLGHADDTNNGKWTFDSTQDEKTLIGYYLTDQGNLDNNREIHLDDLADAQCLMGKYSSGDDNTPYLKILPTIMAGSGSSTAVSTQDVEDFQNELDGDALQLSKIADLKIYTADSISTSLAFPSFDIATSDFKEGRDYGVESESNITSRPIFYGMAINSSFENDLVSFITESSTNYSTSWWNAWLDEHNFSYKIPESELNEYLRGNYSYELSEAGIVVLNLDTIAKIQQEYDQDNQYGTTATIRTSFKILGYILMCYGVLLMTCWAFDTNIDLGFNTLHKVTFGKMIAVFDDAEVPKSSKTDKSDLKYVGFTRVITTGLIIIAIGVALSFVDIVEIMYMLVNTVGKLSSYIGDFLGR